MEWEDGIEEEVTLSVELGVSDIILNINE